MYVASKARSAGLDDRAERLLNICSDLEPYQDRIPPDELADFMESATFACGFKSVEEACESLMGRELFQMLQKVMHAVTAKTPRGGHDEQSINTRTAQNSSPRLRRGDC